MRGLRDERHPLVVFLRVLIKLCLNTFLVLLKHLMHKKLLNKLVLKLLLKWNLLRKTLLKVKSIRALKITIRQ